MRQQKIKRYKRLVHNKKQTKTDNYKMDSKKTLQQYRHTQKRMKHYHYHSACVTIAACIQIYLLFTYLLTYCIIIFICPIAIAWDRL